MTKTTGLGGVIGGVLGYTLGGIGIAVAGTAVGIPALGVAAIGALVGGKSTSTAEKLLDKMKGYRF